MPGGRAIRRALQALALAAALASGRGATTVPTTSDGSSGSSRSGGSTRATAPPWGIAHGRVAEGDFDALGPAAEQREPLVVRNGPARTWPAVERWRDRQYLATALDRLVPTALSNAGPFMPVSKPNPDQALERFAIEDDQRRGFEQTIAPDHWLNLTALQLFKGLDHQVASTSAPLHFGMLDLTSPGDPLLEDLQPQWVLRSNDTHVIGTTATQQPAVQVWLGRQHSARAAGYDEYARHMVQVSGKARYYLVSPEELLRMGLFPANHPHVRHSKLDMADLARRLMDPENPVPYTVAELGPGDLLYIPPLWAAHVVFVDGRADDELSIAVVGRSVSSESVFANYLLASRLPQAFNPGRSAQEREQAFRLLVIELVARQRAVVYIDAIEYIRELYLQRYAGPLARALQCHDGAWDPSTCVDEDLTVPADVQNDVGRCVNLMLDTFKQGRFVSQLMPAALDVLLANFIETLANFVFTPQLACQKLRCAGYLDDTRCPANYLEEDT